jgi:flagellar basal body-associated protein FliL
MEWVALILWILTALGGVYLLATWLQHGGTQQGDRPGRRIKPPLILSHFALAAAGLVVWIVYVANDSDTLAWIAFAALAVVALLGFTMFAAWLAQRGGAAAAETADAAERHFPQAVVGLHGLLAAATLVFVFLTAIGVGD